MKEFSAVDWLNEQLRFEGIPIIPKEMLETAKKIELAQRIDDYNNGHTDRNKNIFKLPK
jgi:hypothetical protein